MPARRLKQFLDDKNVRYLVITHSPAYTAQEIAAAAHLPGRELAKAVVVHLDDEPALAVVPATKQIDFAKLRKASGARKASLATENDFDKMFPGCELGAMPPFGCLYDLPTYADRSLEQDEVVAFNAGTHSELIQLTFDDYRQLAEPNVVEIT